MAFAALGRWAPWHTRWPSTRSRRPRATCTLWRALGAASTRPGRDIAERLFVPHLPRGDVVAGQRVALPESERRHVRSRRYVDGDRVQLFDGSGWVVRGRLRNRGREVECLGVVSLPEAEDDAVRAEAAADVGTAPRLSALVSTPKSAQRADWMVEKLSELGVHQLRHIDCARAEVDAAHIRKRSLTRWQHLCIAAAKQCLRDRLMDVAGGAAAPAPEALWFASAVLSVDEVVSRVQQRSSHTVYLLAAPDAPLSVFQWRTQQPERWPWRDVALMVGPEGGFTRDEDNALRDAGAVAVSLGRTRLRTETAAIAMAAALLD